MFASAWFVLMKRDHIDLPIFRIQMQWYTQIYAGNTCKRLEDIRDGTEHGPPRPMCDCPAELCRRDEITHQEATIYILEEREPKSIDHFANFSTSRKPLTLVLLRLRMRGRGWLG